MSGAKRPESVLVVLITVSQEILLLHRTQPFDFWQSVTGSLEAGETPREAAVREVLEETGLRIAPDALIDLGLRNRYPIPPGWRSRYPAGTTHNTETAFGVLLPFAIELTPCSEEHLEARWLDAPDALTRLWSWTNRDAVRLLVTSHIGER